MGIPRKNLRIVAGKTLLGRCVENALVAEHVDRVVVSTDDDEIAAETRRCGADVVRRPAELSQDLSSSESALLHVLDALQESEGYQPARVVFLQCTCPMTLPQDIDGAIQRHEDDGADVVFSAKPIDAYLWTQGEDGAAEAVNHDPGTRLMRQQRPQEYEESGAIYVLWADAFRKARHRFFGRVVLHPVPRIRSMEIDDEEDLHIAEVLINEKRHLV